MEARWQKALVQLKRLKYVPATFEAKAKAIVSKNYAGALYGVEAAEITPGRIAKMTVAVIDVHTIPGTTFTELTGSSTQVEEHNVNWTRCRTYSR